MVLSCGAQERVGDRVRFVATANGYNGPYEQSFLGMYGTISFVGSTFVRVVWDEDMEAGPGWGTINNHLFRQASLALSSVPYSPEEVIPVDDEEVKTIWY